MLHLSQGNETSKLYCEIKLFLKCSKTGRVYAPRLLCIVDSHPLNNMNTPGVTMF